MTKKSGPTLWIILAVALLSFVIRVWQLSTAIDYTTGFFMPDSGVSSYALGILLVLSIVALIFLLINDKKNKRPALVSPVGEISPKSVLALGIFMLAAAVLVFVQLVTTFSEINIAAIGDGIAFLAYIATAFLLLGNKKIKPFTGIIPVLLAVESVLKAGSLFMQDSVIVRISEELLLLLSYVCQAMFFILLGRFFTGSESELSRGKLIFFASLTLFLTISTSAAKYLVYIIGPTGAKEGMSPPLLTEAAALLTALGIVIILYRNKGGDSPELYEENGTADTTV